MTTGKNIALTRRTFVRVDLYLGEIHPTKCPMDFLGLRGLVTLVGLAEWVYSGSLSLWSLGWIPE